MTFDPATGRAELTVADLEARTGLPAWRLRRDCARWAKRGYPRTRRAVCKGNPDGEWRVDAAEYDAVCAGQITAEPVTA